MSITVRVLQVLLLLFGVGNFSMSFQETWVQPTGMPQDMQLMWNFITKAIIPQFHAILGLIALAIAALLQKAFFSAAASK